MLSSILVDDDDDDDDDDNDEINTTHYVVGLYCSISFLSCHDRAFSATSRVELLQGTSPAALLPLVRQNDQWLPWRQRWSMTQAVVHDTKQNTYKDVTDVGYCDDRRGVRRAGRSQREAVVVGSRVRGVLLHGWRR